MADRRLTLMQQNHSTLPAGDGLSRVRIPWTAAAWLCGTKAPPN